MAGERYSNVQRLCFAGLVIGFLLCTAGGIAPFWRSGKVSADTILGESIPLIGDIGLLKFSEGLWLNCLGTDIPGMERNGCEVYNAGRRAWAARVACAVNILLSLVCAIVACCRCCCCKGGRTIFHGIGAFLSGAAGLLAIALFASDSGSSWIEMQISHYDWAFYLYAVGSGLITLVSFLLCFLAPENPVLHMISAPPTSTYVHMQNEMESINNTDVNPLWSQAANAPQQVTTPQFA